MKKESIIRILVSVFVAELVGILSAIASGGSFSFYESLQQPPLSPPGIVFPIVWTILYALMGLSSALLEQNNNASEAELKTAKRLYAAQLFVNFLWSIVFFRFESIGGALVVILLLLFLLVLMLISFYRVNPVSVYLNLPYLLWVLFAAYLNTGVLILNAGKLS